MSKIKVMVVDDSAFMRKVISNLLEEKGTIEVIGTARNGQDAYEKLRTLTPDVMTLDLEMPIMNGLEFLEKYGDLINIPVIMLSSQTRQGAEETIKALELGAYDFIAKPSGPISLDIHRVQEELIIKVELAATSKRMHSFRPVRNHSPKQTKPEQHTKSHQPHSKQGIVAIGTSTGGPKALQEVLIHIPSSFPYPIFIVQHMPPGFTKSLADRLNALCEIEVCEAVDGQSVEAGHAYIAPGNYHMRVLADQQGELFIQLDKTTPRLSGHRPSVDVLFDSIAKLKELRKCIVILTGMGSDGSKGLREIRKVSRGEVLAIAESETTCVVYGMPRSAIEMGLVDDILPLNQISDQIVAFGSK